MSTNAEMDEAAARAEKELADLDPKTAQYVAILATWWSKHYARAGYRRLGRVLVKQAKALADKAATEGTDP